MIIEFTQSFEKKAKQFTKKNPQLKASLKKQFNTFKSSPLHPSLRLHKLRGDRSEQYSIWIKGDLRALFIISKTQRRTYIFFDLITHDEY